MEITGTVKAVLPTVTGQGKNGEWKKTEFVIEQPGQYPKLACFTLWGDKVPAPAIGDKVTVKFDVESREYNGRYFTECKAWAVSSGQVDPSEHHTGPEQGGGPALPEDESKELPF